MQPSIEWTCLCEAVKCCEKETDTAFAIAFARLKSVDGGDPKYVSLIGFGPFATSKERSPAD